MGQRFFIEVGSLDPPMATTLCDGAGLPIDLTGATVTVESDNADFDGSSCTITDAVNGEVEYRWSAGDTATTGVYEVVFRVDHAGSGNPQRIPPGAPDQAAAIALYIGAGL